MLPVVACDGAQPGGVEIGEVASATVPGQHTDRAFLGTRVHLHVAEVIDPCAAEVSFHPSASPVVVAEEGERRPGAADNRIDVVAAALLMDGIGRRLV